jgi:hypothetical protein
VEVAFERSMARRRARDGRKQALTPPVVGAVSLRSGEPTPHGAWVLVRQRYLFLVDVWAALDPM